MTTYHDMLVERLRECERHPNSMISFTDTDCRALLTCLAALEPPGWWEAEMVKLLRRAGCECPEPLVGYRPDQGPRCRLCNTEYVPPLIAVPEGATGELADIVYELRAWLGAELPPNKRALITKAASTITAQEREIVALREALQDVVEPLGYLRRRAEAKGSRLNEMAYSISRDPETMRRIAQDALSAARQTHGEGEGGGNG